MFPKYYLTFFWSYFSFWVIFRFKNIFIKNYIGKKQDLTYVSPFSLICLYNQADEVDTVPQLKRCVSAVVVELYQEGSARSLQSRFVFDESNISSA